MHGLARTTVAASLLAMLAPGRAVADPRNPQTGSEPPATGSVEQSPPAPNADPRNPQTGSEPPATGSVEQSPPAPNADPRNPQTGSEPPATGSVEQSPPAPNATPPVDDERYTLRAEAGLEYDSNPHRLETIAGFPSPPIVGSGLERLVLTGSFYDSVAPGQTLTLAATAAAKVFQTDDAASENVAIAQSSGAWRLSLGARARLVASVAYYEAFQTASSDPARDAERRDFRSISPLLQLAHAIGESFDFTAGAGWRFLVWKPDRDFDFAGPTAGLDLRWLGPATPFADWEADAGAAYEHRTFGGPALFLDPACVPIGLPCPGPITRLDDFFTSHLEVTRTARALVGLGYAFHYNRSNSYGETATRHFATLRLATPVPFAFTLAARAELLYASYRDSLPVTGIAGNQFVGIDYESRSSAHVDLSRPLGDHLRLSARYTAYFNELGSSSGTYNRQTALISLSYTQDK